ncbi:hypothetical protein [Thalassotalea aquiviva]|uniref:hypothetical protein n=1 Tax=Thalassotalea aquiviva TaxID=3242415 RepID=UPI00352B07B9
MKQTNFQQRRHALKCIGIVGISVPLASKLSDHFEGEPVAPSKPQPSGYQLTDHIKRYYLSLRDN